ncbi:MAG TPA: FAD:protein FMN transferase [Jatrophihabitans sp.]|jgi:thiamine biosynthesis lipoprotein|nr:FAD:protein FMN transferase [Jatrophihabitans sp.]
MSSPAAVPSAAFAETGLSVDGLWHGTFRSMASPVRVQLGPDTDEPEVLHRQVRALFGEVDRQCTRFDPDSDLMRANAAAKDWYAVGELCFTALREAERAHRRTDGWFDPRVLRTLVELGYGSTLPFADGRVDVGPRPERFRPAGKQWRPKFDGAGQRVRVGGKPVDLGGIGKGLALRWAADALRRARCATFLIDAGGDCVFSGAGPGGEGWYIGVEDPAGGDDPVAVLRVDEGACATSSTRLLSWRAGERTVHHLIDPHTGRPGGAGLRSVTVLGSKPDRAEVWSKVLFLHGADQIAKAARERGLAALWVHTDGRVGMTSAMRTSVIWDRL